MDYNMKHLKRFKSIDDETIEDIKVLLLNFEDMGCNVSITNHDETAAKYVMEPGDNVYTIRIDKNFKTKKSGMYKQDTEEIILFKEEELTLLNRLKDLNINFIYIENGHRQDDYYHISKEILIGDYGRYDKLRF